MGKLNGVFILVLVIVLWGCEAPSRITPPPTETPASTSQPPSPTPPSRGGDTIIEPSRTLSFTQVSTVSMQVKPLKTPSECPNLESRLLDLARAENPEAYARIHALTYDDGLTRAIVELQPSQRDLSFLDTYNVTIETQAGDSIQLMIPVASLCELSNHPKVKFVRSPLTPVNP